MYWKKELKKGQHLLTEQKIHKAMKCFETAVTECPVTSAKGLDKSLFYLGLSLIKLGRKKSALRCWHIGRTIQNNGLSRDMIEKHSNPYGMPLNQSDIDDDREAFFVIQIKKYLKMKKVNRFCSEAEKDGVKDIIETSWENMLVDIEIGQFSTDEKIKYFREQIIIFPFSDISYLQNDSVVLYADFQTGDLISMNAICSCGSGLPFNLCCGRIKSPEDLEFEDF
jgi:uncharacterized protein YchJ